MDKVEPELRARLTNEFPEAIQLSAHDPADVRRLREQIIAFFEGAFEEVDLFCLHAQGKLSAEIRATTRVIDESHDAFGTTFRVSAPPGLVARLVERGVRRA
jgi:GTP-binding protein HflX